MAHLRIIGKVADADTQLQFDTLAKRPEFSHVLGMADNHIGYQSMPIGGVTVSDRWVAPGGAGFDIGCGNWAGLTDLYMDDIRNELPDIGHEIKKKIAFGVGIGYGTFADDPWLDEVYNALRHIDGLTPEIIKNQFGSVGSGNHYIDLMEDESGRVWVVLHFGSRQVGYSIAKHYLNILGAKDGMFEQPAFIDSTSELGMQYLDDMLIASSYATLARMRVGVKVVTDVLHSTVADAVSNHHNYIWFERHFGEYVYVTRKGSTPVFPGVPAFIGGSMGNESVIVVGDDSEENKRLFYSAPHGAGRVMGRSQAKGKRNKHGQVTREAQVTRGMMDKYMQEAGVVRVGGDVDESPHCYRNLITDVLPHYPHLTVTHMLMPRLAVMD